MSDPSHATPSRPPAPNASVGPREKALRINLDKSTFGTFAEIGAGQEVARWFFRAGGASGTIAKTVSAYDKQISNALYGKAPRFVTRDRLLQMLAREFGDLQTELVPTRGHETRFFAFANTVATQSYQRREECDGWMGIRFQHAIGAPPSDVLVHVRLLDPDTLPQQEALGIVGVNLVDAALRWNGNLRAFLASFADSLADGRIEVDMVRVDGPAFSDVDNRIASLLLVELGLSSAALFAPEGAVVQASEILYDKDVLVDRGTFRPPTRATVDRLAGARAAFLRDLDGHSDKLQVIAEMTLHDVEDSGRIDPRDFLDRVDLLGTLGNWVLISNYLQYHRLTAFLFRNTKRRAGIALNLTNLRRIYDEAHYRDLAGGLLEAFGRLFRHDLKLYVYPELDPATGALLTAENLVLPPQLAPLHEFLLRNDRIRHIPDFHPDCLPIRRKEVLAKLRDAGDDWERDVPETVARRIKERGLLGYRTIAPRPPTAS